MKKGGALICYISYIIILFFFNGNPNDTSLYTLFSLAVVPASLFSFLLAIYVLIKSRTKWLRLLSIGIMVTSLFPLAELTNLNWKDRGEGFFRVVSFNASFLNVPKVYSDEYFNPILPSKADTTINWIVDQYPDFLMIQEFFDDERSKNFNNLQKILIRGGYKDYFYINNPQHDNGVSRGIITFSKWPIIRKRKIFLGENRFNGAQKVLVALNGDTLRLINVHLQSSAIDIKAGSKSVGAMKYEFRKIIVDGIRRTNQINLVLANIHGENFPTIIAGDFNSTRFSYVYKVLKQDYDNAFENAGTGFGFTFKGWFNLPVKIDHQFYNNGLEVNLVEVADSTKISEHFPVIGSYSLIH